MADKKVGVILLNLGGPDSLGAVRPFLFNLFSDREIIKLGPGFLQKPLAWIISSFRSRKTKMNYRLIGDRSPILDITRSQARALEKKLNQVDKIFKTYVGMRYWHPFIQDALTKASGGGVDELIALPLFPHYSRATTGSCFKELERASRRIADGLRILYVQSWYDHPLYIKALAAKIEMGLKNFPKDKRKSVKILFSAHSLPEEFIDRGDPYVDQLNATIKALSKETSIGDAVLSFQSRSGPVKWIGPSTIEIIKRLGEERVKNLLVVPLSFVGDHIETLYEIDILYRKEAEDRGIRLVRSPSLNDSPIFVDALCDIVKKKVKEDN